MNQLTFQYYDPFKSVIEPEEPCFKDIEGRTISFAPENRGAIALLSIAEDCAWILKRNGDQYNAEEWERLIDVYRNWLPSFRKHLRQRSEEGLLKFESPAAQKIGYPQWETVDEYVILVNMYSRVEQKEPLNDGEEATFHRILSTFLCIKSLYELDGALLSLGYPDNVTALGMSRAVRAATCVSLARALLVRIHAINSIAKSTKELVREAEAQRLSDARHRENRENKDDALKWYDAHRGEYKSDDAIAEKIAKDIVPMGFRTVRTWITQHKKGKL